MGGSVSKKKNCLANFRDSYLYCCLAGSYSIYAEKRKETASGDGVAAVSSSIPALLRWWDAYPAVKSLSIPELTAEEVKKIMSEAAGKEGGRDGFAIIDVRRGDHGVSFEISCGRELFPELRVLIVIRVVTSVARITIMRKRSMMTFLLSTRRLKAHPK